MDHVLDYFNTFFQGGDFDGRLIVFVGPGGVFSFSLGGSGFDSLDGLVVIVLGGGQIDFGLLQNAFIIFD